MRLAAFAVLPLLAACVSIPTGPGVMVLPGSGKTFDQFRADDMDCRQFASLQSGGATPNQTIENTEVKNAAIGAAVGAAAGALIGGRDGAAVGAGTGLIVGAAAGSSAANASGHTLQQRYDFGYQQCMYAKGHQIPTSARVAPRPTAAGGHRLPPHAGPPPPPPPGTPPPPPPGVL